MAVTAMAMFTKWCSTIFTFSPEALYTTRMPKHTMMASTPVSGPSNPRARRVRPPAVKRAAGPGRREFIENHRTLPSAGTLSAAALSGNR